MTGPTCPCCGEPLRYSATKLGGFSVSCGACGFQGFAKSPKAATAMQARITPAAPAAPVFPDALSAVAPKPKPSKMPADREVFGD